MDAGCGVGDFVSYYRNAVGIDVNPYNVDFCRGLALDVHLIREDVFPFDEGTFDGVVMDNVLEHLIDPFPTLSEVRRILRKPGVFVVGVPGRRGYALDADHKVYYDQTSLVALLEGVGFKQKRLLYMPFPPSRLGHVMGQWCLYGVFTYR